jgi:uncharacterized membrane protein HdeD (DUF308 family)
MAEARELPWSVRAFVAVPAAVLIATGALVLADPRIALAGVAFAFGWSQLPGL